MQQNRETLGIPRKPMGTFEFISVALSFVLGLAVTHLLAAIVRVFLRRKVMRVDWIPVAWAISVLLTAVQYWWAIFELSVLDEWRLTHFLIFLGLALLLFVAGALVLPTPLMDDASDLGALFEEHGRWGLLCLSGYTTSVIAVNAFFFDTSPVSFLGFQTGILAILPLVVAASRYRPVRGFATLGYLLLWLVVAYQTSPAAY